MNAGQSSVHWARARILGKIPRRSTQNDLHGAFTSEKKGPPVRFRVVFKGGGSRGPPASTYFYQNFISVCVKQSGA